MGRSLLAIAHPDDETMFFIPTLCNLSSSELFVFCASVGDYEGLGALRRAEMSRALDFLGIDSSHRILLNDPLLPDGPAETWPIDHLGRLLQRFINQNGIQEVFTFDRSGVSGHPNHIALFEACRVLRGCRVFALVTVSAVWKYCLLSRLFPSKGDLVFRVPSFSGVLLGLRLMRMHSSQFRWFRVLYVLFSCYLAVNVFVRAK